MNLIEYRIKQFRELNDNKWFHRMNYIYLPIAPLFFN